MKLPANLTPNQLKVYETIHRIRMAWAALGVVLVLFTIGFVAFLCAVFLLPDQPVAKAISGGIDGLLAWALKIVLANLFPSRQQK